MARKAKALQEENESVEEIVVREEDKKMLEMQKKIDDLTKLIEKMNIKEDVNPVSPQIIIQNAPSKYIKIVSLREGILNLFTEEFGKGRKVASFTKYGETKSVLDTELKKAVDANFSFAEKGYFYICDSDFVHENNLEEAYQLILSPTDIDTIVNSSSASEVVKIFRRGTPEQQELIINKMICKCANDDYSGDVIDKLEKETGIKIREKAQTSKDYKEIYEEEEKERKEKEILEK